MHHLFDVFLVLEEVFHHSDEQNCCVTEGHLFLYFAQISRPMDVFFFIFLFFFLF